MPQKKGEKNQMLASAPQSVKRVRYLISDLIYSQSCKHFGGRGAGGVEEAKEIKITRAVIISENS